MRISVFLFRIYIKTIFHKMLLINFYFETDWTAVVKALVCFNNQFIIISFKLKRCTC